MSTRKIIGLALALALSLALPALAFGQAGSRAVAEFIAGAYSHKAFSTEPVSAADLDLILQAGIRAPSARNLQPWRFTVVKDLEVARKVVPDTKAGNLLVVVSGLDKDGQAASIALDCGLATQNMYLAAQALGLGSHLYTAPIANLNAKLKETVGVPKGYSAVCVVKIGHVEGKPDAVSAASKRSEASAVVNYR